jgi:hypothetical protein
MLLRGLRRRRLLSERLEASIERLKASIERLEALLRG